MRRLKLSEKIDMFMGITSSGNTPALGPVAEEMKLLTIFVDGCTDFLFDKAVPNPRYIFRITNIQSADGSTCALGVAMTWPDVKKVATTLALGSAPQSIGKDHPEGVLSGVHANYHFSYPAGNRWPLNKTFVEKYHAKFNEYPNFQAEGAYTATYALKTALEKANKLMGGWPDDDAIIGQLEGMMIPGPGGYVYIRPDNHQGYKDAITGFSKNTPDYPFPILDPARI